VAGRPSLKVLPWNGRKTGGGLRVGGEGMGNPWDIPQLLRDIRDLRGVMRRNGSRSQAKVWGGGRLHGAQRWTTKGLMGVWKPTGFA